MTIVEPPDVAPDDSQQLVEQLLHMGHCTIMKDIHEQVAAHLRGKTGEYACIEFSTRNNLAAAKKASDQGMAANLRMEFYLYNADERPRSDPFRGIQLPKERPNELLIVFRLFPCPKPSSVVLNAVMRVQVDPHAAAPDLAGRVVLQTDLVGDVGYRRFQQGVCSKCGSGSKVMACGACQMHGYCSKECQKAMWKQHKAMCRRLQKVASAATEQFREVEAARRAAIENAAA